MFAALGMAVLGVLAIWYSASSETSSTVRRARESADQEKRDRERAKREQDTFDNMGQTEHVTRAKALLIAGASQESISEGFKHLSAIDAKSPLRRQAEQLRTTYEAAEKRHELQLAKARNEESKRQAAAEAIAKRVLRVQLAKTIESSMLDKGLNVDVRAIGKDQTTLHLKWILVSKVVAHQMSKQPEFFSNARAVGFRRIEISDGYDETWYWDLN